MFEVSKQIIPILIIVSIHFSDNFYVNGESCHGAVVRNGTNETIIDANNDTWTIRSDSKIDKNGQLAGLSVNVVRLVYWDRIIYQTNRNMGWWKWINNGWVVVNDTQLISNLTSTTGCLYAIISDSTVLSVIATLGTNPPPLSYFVPQSCNDSSYIGDSCNISMQPCNAFKPCQNFGNCTDNPSFFRGYSCMCNPGFNGVDCEFNIQICQPNICLYNGTCNGVNNTDFYCDCTPGRTGIHCEFLINYCNNVICLNKGICRSLILNYTCECLPSTSGRHCEDVSTSLRIHQYVSKSFAYIAIIVISTTTGFIIILDILKYVFGIDVAHRECNRIQPKQRASLNKNNRKKRKSKKTIRRLRRTNKITPLPQPRV